jgi:DNA-binding LacI/PurR family transcriptional regulator
MEVLSLTQPIKNKRTTIHDIADDTGFSIATVSRVVNGTNSFYSESTKAIIEESVRRLNYKPDMTARGLKFHRTYIIAYLVPQIDEFYTSIYNRMIDVASPKGYIILMLSSNNNQEKEKLNLTRVKEKRCDGLIIATGLQIDINDLKKTHGNIPIIVTETDHPYLDMANVFVNVDELCQRATQYLIDNGHKKIAFISAPLTFDTLKHRYEGYKKALNENHLQYDESIVFFDHELERADYNGSYELMKRILANCCFSALLVMSDWAAIAAIKAAKEMSLTIPQDLSIIGFDNLPFTNFSDPPLTTVYQNQELIGENSINIICDMINGMPGRTVRIEGQIMFRKSVSAV